MKLKAIITVFTILLFTSAASAFPGHGQKQGEASAQGVFSNLKPEQMEAWTKLHDDLIVNTEKFRNERKAKRMEYRALKGNNQVSPEYIRKLTERIVELEVTLDKMNDEFIEQSKKEFNLDFSSFMKNYSGYHQSHSCPMMQRKSPHNCMMMNKYNGHNMPDYHHNEQPNAVDEGPKSM